MTLTVSAPSTAPSGQADHGGTAGGARSAPVHPGHRPAGRAGAPGAGGAVEGEARRPGSRKLGERPGKWARTARRGDGAHGPGRYRTQTGRNQKPAGSRHRASLGKSTRWTSRRGQRAGPGVGAGRTTLARPGREPPDRRYGIDQRRQTWRSGGCPRTAHDQGSLCRRRGERARSRDRRADGAGPGRRVTRPANRSWPGQRRTPEGDRQVDEADVNQLREGLPVEVSGDGFEGLVLQGSISAVGRQSITNDTQGAGASYLVTVSLPLLTIEQQAKVRLGMRPAVDHHLPERSGRGRARCSAGPHWRRPDGGSPTPRNSQAAGSP